MQPQFNDEDTVPVVVPGVPVLNPRRSQIRVIHPLFVPCVSLTGITQVSGM
jgi:hypothetical protein